MPRAKNMKNPKAYWKEQWRIMKERGEDDKQLERAKARREYDKAGIDRDGKNIDHVTALKDGGKSTKGNTRLRDPKANMSDNGHKKGEKPGKKRTTKVYRSK